MFAHHPSKKLIRCVVLCAALGAALLSSVGARAEHHLTLAVHPYLPTVEVVKRFTPLAERLSEVLGREVRVSVTKDYADHISSIGEGYADIAYLGPVSYVQLANEYGPQYVLARQSDKGAPAFRGAIIVRDDSPYKTFADLKGTRFAFGDPASTMSHIVPRVMLHNAGVATMDLAEYEFVGGHKTVALSVLAGKFDAGGVKEEIYNLYRKEGLRALALSEEISEHVFIAGKSLGADDREKVRAVLLSLHEEDEGLDVLKSIKPTLTALVPAKDANYAHLRDIMHTFERMTAKNGKAN